MKFYLEVTHYDSMESIGNELDREAIPLRATTLDEAIQEAGQLFTSMRQYMAGGWKDDKGNWQGRGLYPAWPRVCINLY